MKTFRFPLVILLLFGWAALPTVVHAQSTAATVASLQQEMEVMREEMRRLQAEVEDMRLVLAQAQRQTNSSGVDQQLSAQNAATSQALQAQRAEIMAEMDRRFAAMGAETNRALASLTKQVNDALKTSGAGPQISPQSNTSPPVANDMPETGVSYTVKAGDTVSKIARAQGSKVNWILAANKLAPNSTIQVGQKIFIPLKENSSATN